MVRFIFCRRLGDNPDVVALVYDNGLNSGVGDRVVRNAMKGARWTWRVGRTWSAWIDHIWKIEACDRAGGEVHLGYANRPIGSQLEPQVSFAVERELSGRAPTKRHAGRDRSGHAICQFQIGQVAGIV